MDSSYRMVKACLLGAFASLICMCVACFALRPELFGHPHWGFSYYATLWPTIVPYTLGLACGVVCLVVIAHRLRLYGSQMQAIRLFFTLIGNLLLGILLTPIAINGVLFWAHMMISIAILLTQMALLVWILRQPDLTITDRLFVGVSFMAMAHLLLSNEAVALVGWYVLGQIFALGTGLAVLGRLTLRRMASSPAVEGRHLKAKRA